MNNLKKPPLKTPETKWFLDFYFSLDSCEDKLPIKTDLTPHSLKPVLGYVFILEKLPNGFLFRLFGSKIVEIVGRENTKKYMHDTLIGDDLACMTALLNRCLDTPVIIATTERLLTPGKEWIEVEILRCPFNDDHGVPRFIAGTFNRTGDVVKLSGPKVIKSHDIEIAAKHDVLDKFTPDRPYRAAR